MRPSYYHGMKIFHWFHFLQMQKHFIRKLVRNLSAMRGHKILNVTSLRRIPPPHAFFVPHSALNYFYVIHLDQGWESQIWHHSYCERVGFSLIEPMLNIVWFQSPTSVSNIRLQARSGMGARRSSASPRLPCVGTTSASVWPSPRQTLGLPPVSFS